jgi:hypothetical protein
VFGECHAEVAMNSAASCLPPGSEDLTRGRRALTADSAVSSTDLDHTPHRTDAYLRDGVVPGSPSMPFFEFAV